MKRKLLTLLLVVIFAFILALATSAKTIIFVEEVKAQDDSTVKNELFRYNTSGSNAYPATSYSGVGFEKYDEDGDALTWIWKKTSTLDTGETQYTVEAVKTKTLINDNGDGVLTQAEISEYNKLVSVTFDEDCGITKFGNNNSGSGLFHKSGYNSYFVVVNIPDCVEEWSDNCFRNCTNLVEINMSENSKLTDFGKASFFGCTSLRSIYIPKNVTVFKTQYLADQQYYENGLFRNCQMLQNIIFAKDSKLEVLEKGTFNYCKSLKSITLPNSVKTVHPRVFSVCDVLEYVNFGAGLVEFVRDADGYDEYVSMFHNSTKLKTVVLPATFKADTLPEDLYTSFSISNITVYYAGTEAEFKKLQEKFALDNYGSGNPGITKATYNYISPCDAFYGEEHLGETKITYPNGFDKAGSKTSGCTREGCTLNETIELAPIFKALGYSIPEYDPYSAIYAGYQINDMTLYREYVDMYGSIGFGIAIANSNSVGSLVEVGENGNVVLVAEKGLNTDIEINEYSVFKLSMMGFNETLASSLSLVISAYVYADADCDGEKELSFIQYEMANESNNVVNGFNTVTLERAYFNLYPEKKDNE